MMRAPHSRPPLQARTAARPAQRAAAAAPAPPAAWRCACGGACPRCAGAGGSHGSGGGKGSGHGGGEAAAEPAQAVPGGGMAAPGEAAVPAADPVPVASVSSPFNINGSLLAHIPACGNQAAITFAAAPAASAPHTWELVAGTATLDAATTLSATGAVATLAVAPGQTGGTLWAKATDAQGNWAQSNPIRLASHPTGIASSATAGELPNASTHYGSRFDHVFSAHDGQAASLSQVAVGERFPNLPDPDTASHTFATPFGEFALSTGTLPDAASGSAGNWFLTDRGELGGTHDKVSMARSMVDIGQHLVSDSNPTPAHPLPAGFSVDQDFHWWCPWGASGARWTHFASTTHRRELRISNDTALFVTSANAQEHEQDYDGPTGVTAAVASPAEIAPSPSGGSAHTVQVSATQYPTGRDLHYSLRGEALGCTIGATSGVLSIGNRTGSVTVRVANRRNGPHWDEVQVNIANPPAPVPPEAAPEAAPEATAPAADAPPPQS